MQTTESGLQFVDTLKGEGKQPQKGQQINVEYGLAREWHDV